MQDHPAVATGAARQPVQRWRLVLRIDPDEGVAGSGARQGEFAASLRDCGLPVAGLEAVPPRPRMMAAAPLGASILGEQELVDVWLVDRVPRWRVREALDLAMPARHQLCDVFDVWLGEASLPGRVTASVYRVALSSTGVDVPAVQSAIAAMLDSPTLRRERRKGDGAIAYDLRPFVETLELGASSPPGMVELRLTLRHDPERGIGRPDEVLAELGDRTGLPLAPLSIARERLVLGPERAAPALSPVRGPRREGPRGAPAR